MIQQFAQQRTWDVVAAELEQYFRQQLNGFFAAPA
jgi:hypothetical protein